MRAHALVLGTLLTMGYGCVAEVAVQSSRGGQGRGTSVPAASAPATTAAPSAVWCGGTLAPVIVEARGVARLAPPSVMLAGLEGSSAALGCRIRNQLGNRLI